MQQFEMSNLERYYLKRKIQRKKHIRFAIIFILSIFIIATLVFGIILFKNGGKLPQKALNVKTIDAPEYVDVQLIHTGFARTGVKIKKINNVVVHYVGNSGSTAQNNRDYFDKIDTQVCSHFVIGLNGEIIQCVPLDEKSNASNNRNIDTISIEVCHPDDTGKFNDETYHSLVRLTAWLCDNSSLKATDVIRHYDITGKECPKYFVTNQTAWNTFLDDVKEELKKY